MHVFYSLVLKLNLANSNYFEVPAEKQRFTLSLVPGKCSLARNQGTFKLAYF